jgi:MoaA/NifB/PqqE/SkfB family radical SAM enzyme
MCDIWQRPRKNMSQELIDTILSEAPKLGVRWVLLSGGEAMQHPNWHRIASQFRQQGVRVMLLTNGLYIQRQTQQIVDNVDDLIVSLDAADAETYEAIRGVNAFEHILSGMQVCAEQGVNISTRTTVQKANYHQLSDIVHVAYQAGVKQVSFLPIDVASTFAFGERANQNLHDPSLPTLEQVDELERIIDKMAEDDASQFSSGLVAESPEKLRRILVDYFRSIHQQIPTQSPPCNAPHLSVVVEVDGKLRPCYFLPASGKMQEGVSMKKSLNEPLARQLRRAYRRGQRKECQRCVCPLYKSSHALLTM